MKKLSDIYPGAADVAVKDIKINSKDVTKGDIFLCTMGVTADRHLFIEDAVKNGAAAVVVSRDVKDPGVPVVKVPDTNKEIFHLAGELYSYPQNELKMIGVTGTNGKTSVAEMVYDFLGKRCAYLGTNGKKYNGKTERIRNTSPDVDRSYKFFREFLDGGCDTCVSEISSEAMYWHRLDGIRYDICVLTNITEDHLNIHKTVENYAECKANAFSLVKPDGFSILYSGSLYLDKVMEKANGTVLTYGYKKSDDLYISRCDVKNGLSFSFVYGGKEYSVNTKLHGSFNALNIAAAFLVSIKLGVPLETLIKKAEALNPVEGRCEFLHFGQNFNIVLDYAHTEDALNKVLDDLNLSKNGRIVTVTGSAGGREKEKRPRIGKIVLEKSDFVIFTEDDPRNENVYSIIRDMLKNADGKSNYTVIGDRADAIRYAVLTARKNDTVLIAGKGRDNYMAVGNEYIPYCDYDVIEKCFKKPSLL